MKLCRIYEYDGRIKTVMLKKWWKSENHCAQCLRDIGETLYILRGESFRPYCSVVCAETRWRELQPLK